MKYYQGKFRPLNEAKYHGDTKDITYRSLWERQAFKWMDNNPDVIKWSSETTIVPYRCKTDNKMHRYFVDLSFILKNGKKYLVEIKPKAQTQPPKKPKRMTARYKEAVMTYIKNQSKWEAAEKYAEMRGWKFLIWTEDSLKQLGIKLVK